MAQEVFYITVVENEGEEMVELPLEEDSTLSLGTLQCQYPGACGLKYRSPETGAWRGLRVTNGVVSQVNNDWSGNHCYVVVYPKALIDLGEDHLISGCSVNVAFASPMKPNDRKQNQQRSNQMWPAGAQSGYGMQPKLPDNPMEAMGMAMAMMNTWMTPDAEAAKRKSGGRGGQKQGGYSQAGNPYPGNPSWNSGGFQGGFGGGYGNGGVW